MFSAISMLLAQVTAMVTPIPGNWKTYTNVRYGYNTCYPAALRARPEAPNGDGRTFSGANGAQMAVWGNYNADHESLSHYTESSADPDETVTYQVNRPTWNVRSGTIGNSIFWRKTYKRGDQFITLNIIYPVKDKQTYDPFIKTLSGCFKIGSPAF